MLGAPFQYCCDAAKSNGCFMANLSTTGKTPANVAKMATQSDVLSRDSLALIGLFGPEKDMQALVRHPGGKVVRVARGSRLNAGRIVGIDAKGVMLDRNGETVHLTLPQGRMQN